MLNALLPLLLIQPKPISFSNENVLESPVSIIRADTQNPRVRIGVITAEGGIGNDETFASMIRRTEPAAAVNGAYFDKGTKKPIGDIVSNGRVINEGRMGTAFTVNDEGKMDILRVIRHKRYGWGGYQTVLACGPALLLDKVLDVQCGQEGFRDPSVTGSTPRMGLGIDSKGILTMAYIKKPVTFIRMAQIFQKLGCEEAMNLDGGASLAMYYRGNTVKVPGRRLTNVLGVWVTGSSR